MEAVIDSDNAQFPIEATTQTPKSRSFSDTAATPQALAPSPSFHERLNNQKESESKDDHAVPTTPSTLTRRSDFHSRGLSLQMPPRLEMPSPSQFPRPAPLSPQLDQHDIYMQQSQNSLLASPATSLPRHSRGMDFSRASTNLHHSTLAEQRSGDSSPIITQKGMAIPTRRTSVSSMMLDSPALQGWGSVPERSAVSSSIGSMNMLASESESSDSDEDASMGGDDLDDAIFTTPQVHKLQNPNSASTPFGMPTTPGPSVGWATGITFSPAQASLMKAMRRSKIHKSSKKKSRKGSSSASNSGYSSMPSPRAGSPPPMRSIEGTTNGGYFSWTVPRSRRESLALGTDGLNISSGNDSGDEASQSNTPSTPGVVRRAVTRRGNLLPKTKGFARIRAALLEEAAPVDTESRREAETIRQVRERDGSVADLDLSSDSRPQTATAQSSPNLLPAVPESAQEDFGRELDDSGGPKGLGMNFAAHASRNSGGLDYWNRFDPSLRTPPPPVFRPGSSNMSDAMIDSDSSSIPPSWRRPRAHSSTSEASDAFGPTNSNTSQQQQHPSAAVNDDVHLQKFKRRREDDFDIATIKRRAVSPGMSAQNSPILAHSPSHRDINGVSGGGNGAQGGGSWGLPPDRSRKESLPQSANSDASFASMQNGKSLPPSQQPSRHGSNGSGSMSLASGSAAATPTNGGGQGKKLGLQGMLDTNDGIMNMSIE